MHKYVRRGLTIAMMSGGFVLLGSAVASADTDSDPLGLGNVVNSVSSTLTGDATSGDEGRPARSLAIPATVEPRTAPTTR